MLPSACSWQRSEGVLIRFAAEEDWFDHRLEHDARHLSLAQGRAALLRSLESMGLPAQPAGAPAQRGRGRAGEA